MKKLSLSIAIALSTLGMSGVVSAVTVEELAVKLDALAAKNAESRHRLEQVEQHKKSVDTQNTEYNEKVKVEAEVATKNVIGFDNQYSYDMLDSTTRINSKQRLLSERKNRVF